MAATVRRSTKRPKLDHDRILTIPVTKLAPALVNAQVYKPVDPNEPSIIELARSIAEHGQREPIVVTTDNVILSGHRRFAAAKVAGLPTVRCRRENISSDDPKFLTLLIEYNNQRVKSLDERLREEVVRADPEESYRALVEHRRQSSRVDIETFRITGEKTRAKISAAKEPFLDAVRQILDDRKAFWPLSDRQVHYALLNDPPLIHASKPDSMYRNDQRSYKSLIDLVSRARLERLISWSAIHDPTRPVVTWAVYRESGLFIQHEIDTFLKGYFRDLLQSQPNHIEIIGEKNTIQSVVREVAMTYTIPFTIGRGYCSLPPRRGMAERYRRSGKEKLVLLVLSDHDPEGVDIGHSFCRSMRDDFGVSRIVPVRVALTPEQIEELNLPPIFTAKQSSSRYKAFEAEHGDNVFELEAVPPARLQKMLREAIESVLDIKAFNAEVDAERSDASQLDGIRRHIHTLLKGFE